LPKRLELLSELVPPNSAIAMLVNPNNPAAPGVSTPVEELARAKGLQFHLLNAGSETEIETAFEMLAQLRVGGLVITPDPMFNSRDSQLVALAARYAVPTIYYRREFVEGGGLISFGPSFAASFRQVGVYAGRILKGAKPADLPVHQPTKFELVINLKTAKALRLTLPESLWARADEVIE
jgi:putative ABC transport system substrate-binding protein